MFFIILETKETVLNFSQSFSKFYECNSFECNFIEFKVWFNFYQYKMIKYISLNVKLSISQLNKFKSRIKHETEVVLRISSNIIGDNETNCPFQLLVTNRQVANIRKAFANNSSIDIKLSKTQLSKMIQAGGFLGRFLGPLLKTGLPLISNVIKPLSKSVLIPLGLTAAASAADIYT